jgi:hypothetical protein
MKEIIYMNREQYFHLVKRVFGTPDGRTLLNEFKDQTDGLLQASITESTSNRPYATHCSITMYNFIKDLEYILNDKQIVNEDIKYE